MADEPKVLRGGLRTWLVDAVPGGILVFGDEGTITDVNATLCDWLMVDRESLIGRHLETIFPAGGKIFLQTHFLPLLRGSGVVREMYFALRTGAKADLPVLINATRHLEGGSSWNVAIIVVINNRQQFEERLLQSWRLEQDARAESERVSAKLELANASLEAQNAELARIERDLRQSNAVKDEFLGLVSHELRSPLSVLSGGISMLLRRMNELDQETIQDLLHDMERDSARLFTLIDNMLIVARSGVTETVDLEPVLLQRLVPTVTSRERNSENPRSLAVRMESDLPPVLGNPGFIEQIVENFVTNACKYSSPDSPIEVSVKRSEEAGFLQVTVGNDGDPLTAADVDRFFEPFYRDEANRHRRQGLGLGLTVCQRLAEVQHGKVTATPREGGGLEITLKLPTAE
jgi:phosphoserine phosphatase RsbU/P